MKAKTSRKPSGIGVNGSTGDFTSLTQKYDDRLRRMWNFYLAGSEAAFDGLGFRVAQIVVEKAASATNRSRPQRHPSPARPIRRKKTERSDVHDRDRNPRQV